MPHSKPETPFTLDPDVVDLWLIEGFDVTGGAIMEENGEEQPLLTVAVDLQLVRHTDVRRRREVLALKPDVALSLSSLLLDVSMQVIRDVPPTDK